MKQIILLCIAGFLATGEVYAQKQITDSVRLDEVLVTGSKTAAPVSSIPVSVSQVNRTEIENSGQINVLTALSAYMPGIFVTERNILGFGVSTGGSGAISIRGISSQPNTSVLVLIDGHPQYQGLFGHPLSDAYVATDVEKAEVIRGPASILYGSNAMAGVINLITRNQRSEGLNLTAGASYGSYNTQKYFATAGYKKEKWSMFVSGNHDRTDGTRANTDFRITDGYLKTSYEINKNLSLTADFNQASYNANDNGSVYADPAPFNIDILRAKAALSFDNRFANADGSVKIYHNYGKHILSDGFRSTDHNNGLMMYETFRWDKGTSLTAGLDLKQYGGTANRGLNADTLLGITEAALYVYASQRLAGVLSLNAGFRAEFHSLYGFEPVPMGGLTYSPSANTVFKTSVSKGFRNPTVMELYLYAPNPELKPERMVNYELSWLQTLADSKLQFELTAFYARGNNLIQVAGSGPTAQRQNTGSFRNKGIEFSGKYRLLPNLMIYGNYSYTGFEKKVLAAPEQLANLSVNYRYKIWNFNAGLQHVEKLYTRITPAPVTETYTLLNARASAQLSRTVNIYLSGNNLLNKHYEINYGYPMPGINWNTGVKINY